MSYCCSGRWVIVAFAVQIVLLLTTVDNVVSSSKPSCSNPDGPSCDDHCHVDPDSEIPVCCNIICKLDASGKRHLNPRCKNITSCSSMDGGWGSWGFWATCNATCFSNGSRKRYRLCDNPPPRLDLEGLNCEGEGVEYDKCVLHPESCFGLITTFAAVTVFLLIGIGIMLIILLIFLYKNKKQKTEKPVEETGSQGSNEALLNDESEASSRHDSWVNPDVEAGQYAPDAGFPRTQIVAMETNSSVSGHVPIVRIDSDSVPSFSAENGAPSSETDLGESRFDLYGSRNDLDGSCNNLSASDGNVSMSTNYLTAPKPVQDLSDGSFVIR